MPFSKPADGYHESAAPYLCIKRLLIRSTILRHSAGVSSAGTDDAARKLVKLGKRGDSPQAQSRLDALLPRPST